MYRKVLKFERVVLGVCERTDDLQPGNGQSLFRFQRFIYLSLTYTYLDTYPLTYRPVTHTRQGRSQLYSQRCTIDQRVVNTGMQHGCHFGHPCSRAVFTGAGPHNP